MEGYHEIKKDYINSLLIRIHLYDDIEKRVRFLNFLRYLHIFNKKMKIE